MNKQEIVYNVKEEIAMIQIIVGAKGKGKTKILIDKANSEIGSVKGNVIYLDKSNKNMYELNNKIRLINVRDYCIETPKEFIGFVCGLIAANHDLQKIYLDSFMKIACTSLEDIDVVLDKIEMISTKFQVDFIISISISENDLPDTKKQNVIVAL